MLTNNAMLATPASQREKTNIDTRPTLAKFRRLGLYVILRHNGHDISEDMPRDEMLAYASAHEKSLTLDGLIVSPAEYGGFNVNKPREVTEHEKELDAKIQEKREKYDDVEWDELKAEALDLNIDITRMQKDEVIAVLVAAKKDTPQGYDALSWHDLKKVAKERGIETHGKKKPEILAALKGE